MPRIRTIKPEHWGDKELPKISLQAHLLWIGIWNFSDDSGIIDADPLYIKSNVFPRRSDVRVEQVSQWLDQLVKARFLVPFEYENESYYVSRTFETHQRIDRPTPSKIPSDIIRRILDDSSTIARSCIGKEGSVEEGKGANAPPIPAESDVGELLRKEYKSMAKDKQTLYVFIRDKKPDFIEPYVDFWNIFAQQNGLPKVEEITDRRRKKFRSRRKEKRFDFPEILRKADQSEFILTSKTKWFSFDWVINCESNYLKVIEGNYNKNQQNGAKTDPNADYEKRRKALEERTRQISKQ